MVRQENDSSGRGKRLGMLYLCGKPFKLLVGQLAPRTRGSISITFAEGSIERNQSPMRISQIKIARSLPKSRKQIEVRLPAAIHLVITVHRKRFLILNATGPQRDKIVPDFVR